MKGAKVSFHPLSTALKLHTIGEDDPCWRDGVVRIPANSYIRIRPPADATPELIERVKQSSINMGAIHVRLLPKVATKAIPDAVIVTSPVDQPESVREEIERMIRDSQIENKDAVRSLSEEILAKVGL